MDKICQKTWLVSPYSRQITLIEGVTVRYRDQKTKDSHKMKAQELKFMREEKL